MAQENGPALLVIDMLQDYFDHQPALAEQRDRLVTCINDLTRRFRQHGLPVIWIRQEFRPDLSDAFLNMRRDGIRITIAGTSGAEALPGLVRMRGEVEIIKKRYSAFFQTELDGVLNDLRPTSLVVAGINTHACIRTAVVDAFQRDYDVIIATECVGSYDRDHHDITLRYLGGHIARLLTNDEIESVMR